MSVVLKYRLRCTTDNVYEYVWAVEGDPAPTLCPTDTAHTVDQGQTAVVETVGSSPKLSDDSVMLIAQQPQTPGYEMCDRDIKLNTGLLAASFEDLRINVTTRLEEPWVGEISLIGVYKSDGAEVADQADADANGVLSIWQYGAVDQADGTTLIPWNIRGGTVWVDGNIPAVERFDHRVYALAVPGLGQAYYVRLFDGYLGHMAGGTIEALSPSAKLMDPSLAPGLSNVIRVYVYYPAGAKRSHILRLVTYRPKGTF